MKTLVKTGEAPEGRGNLRYPIMGFNSTGFNGKKNKF